MHASSIRRIVAGAFLALSLTAYAQDSAIGYVKTHAGDAFIVSGQDVFAVFPGLALKIGDQLRTGKDGRLGLTLLDNTVLSLGPNAELVIDEYLFRPGEGEAGLAMRLLKGTLQFISGAIARLRPEAVEGRTSTGTIGVRGTRFVVRAEE